MIRGLMALVALVAIPIIACAVLTLSFSAWRVSANEATVAVQRTAQTRIEWNARVQIAEIEADTDKKTDGTFILFYVARWALWMLSGLAALLWALVGVRWWIGREARA